MYKYIPQTNQPHQAKLLFLSRANVYFRPTGYHIKPTLSRWKGCLPAKAKMKKAPQPFKRQLNCWKQLKLKPPTLCTRILDAPQKQRAPAPCQNHGPRDTSGARQGQHCHSSRGSSGSWFILEPSGLFCFPCFLRLLEWRRYGCCLGCENVAVAQGCTGSPQLFSSQELEPCSLGRATKWYQEYNTWFHINCPVCVKVSDVERFGLDLIVNWKHGTILLFQNNSIHY